MLEWGLQVDGPITRGWGGGVGGLIRGCLRYLFTCQVALRGHCFISWLDCVSFSHDPILGRSLHVTAEIRQLLGSLTDYLSFRINITLIPSFF